MTVDSGPGAGDITVRIRRTLAQRAVEGISLGGAVFLMAAVFEWIRPAVEFDPQFWILVALTVGVYAFVTAGEEVLHATRDHVQLDRAFESLLFDRSQHDLPVYDSTGRTLTYRGTSGEVRFAKGIGPTEADLVLGALGQAGLPGDPAGAPQPGLEFFGRIAGKMLIGLVAIALIAIGASKSLSYAGILAALVAIELASSAWRRRHPRTVNLRDSG